MDAAAIAEVRRQFKQKYRREPDDDEMLEAKAEFTLNEFGFKDVKGILTQKLSVDGAPIDACGGFARTYWVLECKFSNQNYNLRSDIEMRAQRMSRILNHVKRNFGGKYKEVVYSYYVEGFTPRKKDVTRAVMAGFRPKTNFINDAWFDKNRLWKGPQLPELVIYPILKDLDAKAYPIENVVKTPFLETNAYQIKTDKKTFYIFFLPVEVLLRLVYVRRLRGGAKGAFQRWVKPDRIKEIGEEFLNKGGFFPNSIILSFSSVDDRGKLPLFTGKKLAFLQSPKNCPVRVGKIKVPLIYSSALLVDGQHRLYGFAKASSRIRKMQALCCAAFVGLTPKEEAKLFVDINSNAKPVPPEILWTLYGDLIPQSKEGRISKMALDLAKTDLLKTKINVPGLNETRGAMKINNICSEGILQTSINKSGELAQLKLTIIDLLDRIDHANAVVFNKSCKHYIFASLVILAGKIIKDQNFVRNKAYQKTLAACVSFFLSKCSRGVKNGIILKHLGNRNQRRGLADAIFRRDARALRRIVSA